MFDLRIKPRVAERLTLIEGETDVVIRRPVKLRPGKRVCDGTPQTTPFPLWSLPVPAQTTKAGGKTPLHPLE